MSLSDLSADDISLSSEDEIVEVGPSRVFRDRMNPMEQYNEKEFRDRYRLPRHAVIQLVELLKHIEPMTRRNHSISAVEQLLLTINFYASGGFQISVADNVRVHKSTACRIIKKVSVEIAKLRQNFIKMPTTVEDRNSVKSKFYTIRGFPSVVGALDCTHIKIQSPGGPTAEVFRNRKGFFSLNVQAVCDPDLMISDIICRWPGSVHDTTIFNDSHLRADFERGVYGSDILLGDSGYPCRKYLLTPFLQPRSESERKYNEAQIATRNPIERCFGVLKRRFACLSMGLRVKLDTAMNVIVACAILHNIAISHNDLTDNLPEIPTLEDVEIPTLQPYEVSSQRNENFSVRSALLMTHFQ